MGRLVRSLHGHGICDRLGDHVYDKDGPLSFSKPSTLERSHLKRIIILEKELKQLRAEHNELWAGVGVVRADIVSIYSVIQADANPHKFAFSPLERLSYAEHALAHLSNKIQAIGLQKASADPEPTQTRTRSTFPIKTRVTAPAPADITVEEFRAREEALMEPQRKGLWVKS